LRRVIRTKIKEISGGQLINEGGVHKKAKVELPVSYDPKKGKKIGPDRG
jgi:hypothetical protein